MALDTNLNVSPYFDDFSEEKNFHKILFRPAAAVQARELTQLQTILQNQIERFGDNIFVEGTIIQGCNFTLDSKYNYVKLPDLRVDGQPTNPDQFVGYRVASPTSNLQAIVVNSEQGLESQNPDLHTIYVKYINSGTTGEVAFANNEDLYFYSNTDVANTTSLVTEYTTKVAPSQINSVDANPTGNGYAFSVGEGIIFQKGFFVRVANNLSTVVSKYSSAPNNLSVGFSTTETIVTEYQDNTLYDGTAGFTNENAPGAHRLKLTPSLVVANSDALPSNNFFSLVDWKNGLPVRVNQVTQYNSINKEMARREYETNGDFVVRPFKLGAEVDTASSNTFNLVVSSGLGYINGYRAELQNSSKYSTRKGTDTQTLLNQSVSASYGNYVVISEMAGYFTIGSTVNLYDTVTAALTNESYATISPVGTLIGTATVLSVLYSEGTVDTATAKYYLYLTNIQMNSGKAFSSVKSCSSSTGVGDVVLTRNVTTNTNIAVLTDPNFSKTIFQTGKSYVKTLVPGASVNTSFIFRKTDTVNVYSNGMSSSVTLTGNQQFYYGTGTLTSLQEKAVIIVPAAQLNVTNATGTVTTSSGSANVTGSSTLFLTAYQENDYIRVGNATVTAVKQVKSIANNTFLTVSNAFSAVYTSNNHNKCYPKNIPINLSDRNSRVVLANTTSLSFFLVNSANTVETLAASANAYIYYDVKAVTTAAIQKTINKSRVVCIDTALFAPIGGTFTCNTNSTTVTSTNTSVNTYISVGYKLYQANNSSNSALIGTVSSVNSTAIVLTSNATLNLTTNAITYSANNSAGTQGPWPLGFPDVQKISAVYKIGAGNTFTTNSSYDVTSSFVLDKNQSDTMYGISKLSRSPGAASMNITNGDKITVVFDVFTIPTSSSVGFFSIDSYPIDDANTANTSAIQTQNIPVYTSSTGEKINLRDSIDFRSYVANTISLASTANVAAASASYAIINPTSNTTFSSNGFITPDQSFGYDVTYYLGRIDKVLLTTSQMVSVIEGKPSENPQAPAENQTGLTLGTVTIPPYPTLISSQITYDTTPQSVVAFTTNQNRRYTMKDINSINSRVNNLEYYSSLSLLESKTKNLVIKSDITGLDRFKNGIFVDNFESGFASNLLDKEYFIAVDPEETSLIPRFDQFKVEFDYNSNENANTALHPHTKTNAVVTLPYTEKTLISQTNTTRTRSITEGYYNWTGQAGTVPAYDTYVEPTIPPKPVDPKPDPQPPTPGPPIDPPVPSANTHQPKYTPPTRPSPRPQTGNYVWIDELDTAIFVPGDFKTGNVVYNSDLGYYTVTDKSPAPVYNGSTIRYPTGNTDPVIPPAPVAPTISLPETPVITPFVFDVSAVEKWMAAETAVGGSRNAVTNQYNFWD